MDIDDIRRANMQRLESDAGGATAAGDKAGMSAAQWTNLREGAKDSKTGRRRGMRKDTARRIEEAFQKPAGWLDSTHDEDVQHAVSERAAAPYHLPATEGQEPDLVIAQYGTGGAMGHGFNLADNPPGLIKSWRVDHEWLRLNVPSHTGIKNLAIVTGFGPSMKGMFNPGDPLLVDRGVNLVDHDGVYFFRVGDEGFIKLLQRVPEFDGPGFRLRVISKNPDFPPYDLSPKNPHFEVLAKVLTIWKSEHF